MPKVSPKLGRYSAKKLNDDSLYIGTKEAVQYFPWLKGENSAPIINDWIKNGWLLGRCINISQRGNHHSNRWQVFVPDIERFKRDRIKTNV